MAFIEAPSFNALAAQQPEVGNAAIDNRKCYQTTIKALANVLQDLDVCWASLAVAAARAAAVKMGQHVLSANLQPSCIRVNQSHCQAQEHAHPWHCC